MATLYAAKAAAATTSDLYTLDPATAAPTSVGASGHAFTSLAFDIDGTLYGTTSAASSSGANSLYTLDPVAGAATLVGAMGGTVSDIAFDAAGQLWGWTRKTAVGGLGGAFAALLRIDKTDASFTVIGSSGLDMQGGGISFHSGGTLYGLLAVGATGELYTIDTATGAISVLSAFSESIVNSASFDGADLLWYMRGGAGGSTSLKTVTVGLTRSTIGNPGANFDALAWGPSPPPPAAPAGFVLALDSDDPYAPAPDWTRVDNQDGVHVKTIRVTRGRPDERSKTQTGTAVITGIDTSGTLDPTNPTGPFWDTGAGVTKIDPIRQTGVALFNPVTETWHWLFRGHLGDPEWQLDTSEKFLAFTLDATDLLDILNDAQIVPDNAGNTVPAESTGDCFYTGQHVDDRLLALLADSATAFLGSVFPPELLNIFTGNVNVVGRVMSAGTTVLQAVDEACDAEYPGLSNRFVSKEGVFSFRGRKARQHPEDYEAANDASRSGSEQVVFWDVGDIPAADLDDTLAVYTSLTFGRGKTNLINNAIATPLDIAESARAGQFVYDAASVAKYGPRTSGLSLEDLITGDGNDDGLDRLAETKKFANYWVDNYKLPRTRISQLTFENPPAGATLARRTATWALLCGVELGDVVTVQSTHPGGGGFNDPYLVEQISYEIAPLRGDESKVTLTLDLSPRDNSDPFPA